MADERESQQPNVDVIEIFRRRGALFLWVVAVVVLIGVAIAYRSTPMYESRGVLLAELPSVSEAVRSMVQTRPESRVTIITQRVLTNDNLQEIIDKNGLYPDLADTPAEARARFRNPSHLRLSAEDPQILERLLGTTRPEGALAFSVSFSDTSPRVARDVANDLVDLYLEENREARREQAAETIRFLTGEALRIEEEIAAREQQLAAFKTENAGALPDLADSNMQMLDRISRDLDAVEQEIRTLRERQALYSSQLGLLSPSSTYVDEQGAAVLSPQERLRVLQRRHLQLSSIYSADHPDVQKVRRELEALGESTGLPAFDRATLESELQAREDELAAARERYAADHPDVQRLERTVQAARSALAAAPRTPTARRMPSTPDNPAYVQTEVQLRSAAADLQAALERRAELRERYAELEQRLQVTPEVEREYSSLSRGLVQLIEQYNDTQAQINESRIALNFEQDPTGERFTVLEQPTVPDSPSSPNRFAVLVLSLAIALVLGAAVVAAAERSDQAVRNAQDIVAYLEIPPLVAIPYVENRVDLRRRARRRLFAAGAVSLWLGAIFLLVVTPL
jgi:succinoglycan biosynthesis transport protein ExoP